MRYDDNDKEESIQSVERVDFNEIGEWNLKTRISNNLMHWYVDIFHCINHSVNATHTFGLY